MKLKSGGCLRALQAPRPLPWVALAALHRVHSSPVLQTRKWAQGGSCDSSCSPGGWEAQAGRTRARETSALQWGAGSPGFRPHGADARKRLLQPRASPAWGSAGDAPVVGGAPSEFLRRPRCRGGCGGAHQPRDTSAGSLRRLLDFSSGTLIRGLWPPGRWGTTPFRWSGSPAGVLCPSSLRTRYGRVWRQLGPLRAPLPDSR